ncbi:MAG: HAMP domain-containing histidine kinase [Chitinophagaceae bacterium]|nr:MAG: HAMP domain-containing histidine kinase [Chitinophagaceae bacterium]
MFQQIFNWRTVIAVVAILIVSGTIFYSKYLAGKIAREERQKVEEWVEAGKFLISSPTDADTKLAAMILTENKSIPIIETNEKDSITKYINLDSAKIAENKNYLYKKLSDFKSQNKPIEWLNPLDSTQRNLYYYGESLLLKEVRYYPIVQLVIVGLLIIITLVALRSSYRSVQNQVWAGMAKETAHQLGTPVSSLEGWVEMLRQNTGNEKIVTELEKDVDRLQLITDRFGKIGSKPQLEEKDLVKQISNMVEYIRKRATGKVIFNINTHSEQVITALISGPLFDWVIENLLKNSLDSMEGKGNISIDIKKNEETVHIDVSDTGKGISNQHISKVFNPGFTTKKRGWGLGLSLSKRIIVQYHKGEIFVKNSEPGKGTTFRIVLKK